MYHPNTRHQQYDIFGVETYLPRKKLEKLQATKEYAFYRLIFCNIDEDLFSVLYSDKKSRPNAPVNTMVSALILMQQKGWTYEQLFNSIDFDLTTRAALGLQSLADTPFVASTLFSFQNRVNDYWVKEGVNLLELVFDSLTQQQLKELKLKTDIQRSDSFLAASNIRSYSRIQLLVEVLIRFYRVLNDEDKETFSELLAPYVKKTSGQFIYRLKREDIPHELEQLGQVYHALYTAFKGRYGEGEIFRIFRRVYEEHFTLVEAKVIVNTTEELHSGMLQSPDDIEATYRLKGTERSKGQVISITETAHPENELNLLTDVAVEPNHTDDTEILNKRIDVIKGKTPDLRELHTDGGYGSETNDEKLETLKIDHIQTGVRGKEAEVPMEIERLESGEYAVSCPEQQVLSEPTRKRFKAAFDAQVCKRCSRQKVCSSQLQKRRPVRVYYFTPADYLKNKRRKGVEKIPPERRKLRPNVEATVKEFRKGMNHKNKLKVRGKFRTEIYAFTMAISINFGRIFRYLDEKADKGYDLLPTLSWIRQILRSLLRRVLFWVRESLSFSKSGLVKLQFAY